MTANILSSNVIMPASLKCRNDISRREQSTFIVLEDLKAIHRNGQGTCSSRTLTIRRFLRKLPRLMVPEVGLEPT
jgi:hypothetical protein